MWCALIFDQSLVVKTLFKAPVDVLMASATGLGKVLVMNLALRVRWEKSAIVCDLLIFSTRIAAMAVVAGDPGIAMCRVLPVLVVPEEFYVLGAE